MILGELKLYNGFCLTILKYYLAMCKLDFYFFWLMKRLPKYFKMTRKLKNSQFKIFLITIDFKLVYHITSLILFDFKKIIIEYNKNILVQVTLIRSQLNTSSLKIVWRDFSWTIYTLGNVRKLNYPVAFFFETQLSSS